MPGLPNDWFASAIRSGAGAAAIAQMPVPSSNVSYVVAHLSAILTAFAALAGPYGPVVQVSDGVSVLFSAPIEISGAAGDSATLDIELPLVVTMGRAVSATFSAASIAGLSQYVAISGTLA